MRILQIVPLYYPHIGGVEYVVKSVAERLVRMGHDVAVLVVGPEVERPREEIVGDVKAVGELRVNVKLNLIAIGILRCK